VTGSSSARRGTGEVSSKNRATAPRRGTGEVSSKNRATAPRRGTGEVSSDRPNGSLVLVATPIGNLGDLSPRAVSVLAEADLICCEDTRRTRALMTAAGVRSRGRLVSLHEHNEAARIPELVGWLAGGTTVALVTDAGTPGVSDPGSRAVAAVVNAGFEVTTVPGPSAALGALVISGLPTDRFCIEGFLARRGTERRQQITDLATERRTAVLFESPKRLVATLNELVAACGGERRMAVVRELTKVHEEVWRGSLAEAVAEVGARPIRGEVVIVLGGAPAPPPPTPDMVAAAVADRLAAGDGARKAADTVAKAFGVPRRQAYQAALELRSGSPTSGPPAGARPPEGTDP